MSLFENRPNAALLVVDVQQDVVAQACRRDETIANINALVAKARQAGVPVVWVQHDDEGLVRGSAGWQLAPELAPTAGEARIEKQYGDAFEATSLEAQLASLGVGKLVVCGAETDACIRSTIHGALARGYDTILVSDAHTTGDKSKWGAPPPDQVIAHTNLYWTYQRAPGRTAGTVKTAETVFASA